MANTLFYLRCHIKLSVHLSFNLLLIINIYTGKNILLDLEVVGKCRFWHSSIFRIGFSFDDVTSNRTGPESASVATTYGVADSGPVLFLESDFGAMTSRRLVAVATTYGVADYGTVLFLESDFGATTSLVSAMVGDISDSGTFWCVPGVRGVSL